MYGHPKYPSITLQQKIKAFVTSSDCTEQFQNSNESIPTEILLNNFEQLVRQRNQLVHSTLTGNHIDTDHGNLSQFR